MRGRVHLDDFREDAVLVISEQHMAALHRTVVVGFENEMVAHSLQFAPKLAKVIGEEQLRRAIRAAITRAQRHGFSHRGPVRLSTRTGPAGTRQSGM